MLKAFTVYDLKAEFYMKPFFCLATGEAVRSFADAINDPQSPFYKHPDDYTLYEIGTFDEQIGELSSVPPVNLGSALNFKIEEGVTDFPGDKERTRG